jgi:hypothetical protein
MTIDERLKALTRKFELRSLETKKHDKQFAQLATLVAGVTEGTTRLLAKAESHKRR